MRLKTLIIVGGIAMIGSGCQVGYVETHESAKKTLPWAVQMERLFGDADHFITHYGFWGEETNTWNTEVYFGGRYEFCMQIEVVVDYVNREVTPAGAPKFFLNEARRVEVEPDGRTSCYYARGFRFGQEEWESIYYRGGDFSAADIQLLSSEVPNFDKYAAARRRPRILISLLPDPPEGTEIKVVDSRIVKEGASQQSSSEVDKPQPDR